MSMTTLWLDKLLTACDLSCEQERLELADLLDEAGREDEASLLRSAEPFLAVVGQRIVRDSKTTWFIDPKRGFANEYEVYAVPTAYVARFEAVFPAAQRVTRRVALRQGWSRPAEARRDGEFWLGGACQGTHANRLPCPAPLAERVEACRLDTVAVLEQREMLKG